MVKYLLNIVSNIFFDIFGRSTMVDMHEEMHRPSECPDSTAVRTFWRPLQIWGVLCMRSSDTLLLEAEVCHLTWAGVGALSPLPGARRGACLITVSFDTYTLTEIVNFCDNLKNNHAEYTGPKQSDNFHRYGCRKTPNLGWSAWAAEKPPLFTRMNNASKALSAEHSKWINIRIK